MVSGVEEHNHDVRDLCQKFEEWSHCYVYLAVPVEQENKYLEIRTAKSTEADESDTGGKEVTLLHQYSNLFFLRIFFYLRPTTVQFERNVVKINNFKG